MDKYNFDVKEMVENFSLEDFFQLKDNKVGREAFLLITDNQYVSGYTKSFGYGDYSEAISNTIKEIYGLKKFVYRREIDNINEITKGIFVTAKMENSSRDGVSIYFNIDEHTSISMNQFELFEAFYDKNNDIINSYSKKLGYPIVKYYLPNEKSYVNDYGFIEDEIFYEDDDLSNILEILKNKVDQNKVVPKEENIIGNIVKKDIKVKTKNYVV